MQIKENTVVLFHYDLSDDKQQQLESSKNEEPLAVLIGHNNIILGLEEAMLGKQKGDNFSVTLVPEKAYGVRNEEAVQRVPMKHLQGEGPQKKQKWKAGMVATIHTEQGARQVTVIKAGKFSADIDCNHPFAGKTLTFDITIEEVREASQEEIAHKHAHGVGGHHH